VFEDDYEAARGEVGRPSGRVHQDAGHQKFEDLKKEKFLTNYVFITLKSALFFQFPESTFHQKHKYNQRSNLADRDLPYQT
jgi:hypothetical protein